MDTQCKRVLKYMENHDGITTKQAMEELGIFRLGARIYDLRKSGIDIQRDWTTVRNRYGEDCRIRKYWIGNKEAKDAEKDADQKTTA